MENQKSETQLRFVPYILELLRSAEQEAPYTLLNGKNTDDYLRKLAENAEIVLWTEAGRVKGLISFYCNDPDKDLAFITMLVVDHGYRRGGIGRTLLNLVLHTARTRSFRVCQLKVHRSNCAAINLYESFGFAKKENNSNKSHILMELLL